MKIVDTPEGGPEPELDPLARFRSWRGFLLAAVVLNALFVWGMWGAAADPSTRVWVKVLSWFPFNVIATVLYLVFMAKLSKADEEAARAAGGADLANTGAVFYVILCLAMIAANWIIMFIA